MLIDAQSQNYDRAQHGGKLAVCRLADALGDAGFLAVWDCLAQISDVYYQTSYLALEATRGEGEMHLAHFESAAGHVLKPFILRPAGNLGGPELHDIVTPFEYGGPLALAAKGEAAAGLAAPAQDAFEEYCVQSNIVSEFIRFHPLLGNGNDWSRHYDLKLVGQNMAMDLGRSGEDRRAAYSRSQQRNLRKAEDAGASVRRVPVDQENIEILQGFYLETQSRLQTPKGPFFGGRYFDALASAGEDLASLYFAEDEPGRPVSALLAVHGRVYAHSHIIGSGGGNNKKIADTMLYHLAADDLALRGFRYFHLGGAALSQPGVRTFKEGLSNFQTPYYVGTKIYDADAYGELCVARDSSGNDLESGYFPAYRAD